MTDQNDARPASLTDILGSATRVQRTATVCVAGHLNDEFYTLERKLIALAEQADVDSLGDPSVDERREVALRMEAVREEMRRHEHRFTFERLDPKAWSDLSAEHPRREGKIEAFDPTTFPLAACLASLVEVNGAPLDAGFKEQFTELWTDKFNEAQRGEMFNAAWEANTGRADAPFSEISSAVLRNTDAR